jgi:hypothetical protein
MKIRAFFVCRFLFLFSAFIHVAIPYKILEPLYKQTSAKKNEIKC